MTIDLGVCPSSGIVGTNDLGGCMEWNCPDNWFGDVFLLGFQALLIQETAVYWCWLELSKQLIQETVYIVGRTTHLGEGPLAEIVRTIDYGDY